MKYNIGDEVKILRGSSELMNEQGVIVDAVHLIEGKNYYRVYVKEYDGSFGIREEDLELLTKSNYNTKTINNLSDEEMIEKLKEKYNVKLTLKKELQFTVSDILNKYKSKICDKLGISENDYSQTNAFECGIRKIVCAKYGILKIKDLKAEDRENFRNDLEKLIKEYILEEE